MDVDDPVPVCFDEFCQEATGPASTTRPTSQFLKCSTSALPYSRSKQSFSGRCTQRECCGSSPLQRVCVRSAGNDGGYAAAFKISVVYFVYDGLQVCAPPDTITPSLSMFQFQPFFWSYNGLPSHGMLSGLFAICPYSGRSPSGAHSGTSPSGLHSSASFPGS